MAKGHFMGLLGKIGDGIKKTGNTIAYNRQRKQDDEYIASCILERFDVNLIKNFCKYHKVGEPAVSGRKNKSHWVEHASTSVELEKVKTYAKRHKILLDDIEDEEAHLAKKRMEEYKDLFEGN